MRVRGTGCVLIGPEGRTPPLPFVTVDDGEGHALIAMKLAEDVDADAAPAEDANAIPDGPALAINPTPAATPVLDEDSDAEPEVVAEPEAVEPAPAEPETPAVAEPESSSDDDRAETIAAALDLVDEDGLVKTGERAGRPKVSAVEAITGLADITADEIDAAIVARDAAD